MDDQGIPHWWWGDDIDCNDEIVHITIVLSRYIRTVRTALDTEETILNMPGQP